MKKRNKKIGLALGGGGARGCAHVGVIKALEEAGIPIDYIAGTSIGSFIGGIYVAGDIKELEEYLLKIKWKDVVKHFDPVVPRQGLFKGEKVKALLKKLIKKTNIKKARIPYVAVATDLYKGEEVWIDKGNIINAIRASIAIPGIFTPAKYKNSYLVDGGVTNPLPVNVLRKLGADIVIAVDLNHHFIREKINSKRSYGGHKNKLMKWLTPKRPNIIDVIEGSLFLMEDKLTEKNLIIHEPDFLIRPMLGSSSIFDFHHAKKLIREGYKDTQKIIPSIKKKAGV